MSFRVTYSVLNADLAELHAAFDQALVKVRARLGGEFPSYFAGAEQRGATLLDDLNPADTRQVLARFHATPTDQVDRILDSAHAAQKDWGRRPWADRARIVRRAAELISERRLELAAIMSLEAGKNRLEALGDVEESADLFRYYAGQLEESGGFARPLARLSPDEDTRDVLRPYGVFVVVSPFNFPMALAAGMTGAALLGGNAAILKPSHDAPWTALGMYQALRDAGLPDGVLQLVFGRGAALGDALASHPRTSGVVFTGSQGVGMRIMRQLAARSHPHPCLLEMGGKNPAIVCADADLSRAIEGCARSAFGLSGQKCSALSRVYVHRSRKDEFLAGLVARTGQMKVGDPTAADVFVGPLINQAAYDRFVAVSDEARRDGTIHTGAVALRGRPGFEHGWFVTPTIAELPRGHRLFKDELFLPFLSVDTFDTLEEAVVQANDCDYGLTAGIFSNQSADVEYFMDHAEAGVLYANRKTGATTGAWPGVQSFTGWKGSGSTGKGGCGPYYVAQFMREQSQTRMA